METDAGVSIPELRVDGGATANNFLMQFQADLLGCPVVRADVAETTALGAAFLAGLATGVWKGYDDITKCLRAAERFEPTMGSEQREALYADWRRAVERSLAWEKA